MPKKVDITLKNAVRQIAFFCATSVFYGEEGNGKDMALPLHEATRDSAEGNQFIIFLDNGQSFHVTVEDVSGRENDLI